MKSYLFYLSLIVFSLVSLPWNIWAESWTVSSSSGTNISTGSTNSLLLSGVTVDDDTHINMNFTQNIVIESVRIRIAKQSDGTNIKVDSLTGILDMPKSLSVTLVDLLEAWESYTITIISALSDQWIAITEWSDALSEFTTPKPLKQSLIVFNAPTNPTAVTSTSIEASVSNPNNNITDVAGSSTDEAEPTIANEELPLTGTNPLIFLIISWILALIIVLRRKTS